MLLSIHIIQDNISSDREDRKAHCSVKVTIQFKRKDNRSGRMTIQFKIREANLLYLSLARIILSTNQLVVRLSTARKYLYSTMNLFLNSDGYLQLMQTILYILGRMMEKFGSQIYC